MRKNAISILAVLGGFLAIYIGVFTPVKAYFLNYRELPNLYWLYLESIKILALYVFGIYTTAFVFLQMPSQESDIDIEPSFLVVGGIIGALAALALFTRNPLAFVEFFVKSNPWWFLLSVLELRIFVTFNPWLFLLSVLGVRIACQFPRIKSNFLPIVFLSRTFIPFLLTLTFIWLHNSSFPGLTASPVVRQQWAEKEFRGYSEIVNKIKTCPSIINRVGNVKYVAPTRGFNYVQGEEVSSGYHGQFTLEVIGDRGIGVSNFSFYTVTAFPGHSQFTYQGKTEKIACGN